MFSWLRRKTAGPPEPPPPPPRPDPAHRIYAVGDVHGRYDLLEVLLWKLKADADAQEDGRDAILVFLGDLIDRGDNTRDVIDAALAAWLTWPQVVCLRGNHEAALLDFLDDPERGASWLGFGGRQTIGSYGVAAPTATAQADELRATAAALAHAMAHHIDFLRQSVELFRSGDVICAHSGIDPQKPLDEQSASALLWGRSQFLELGAPDGLRIVHGHWDNPDPVVTPGRIGIDTGAYYTGRLTAVRLDAETELFMVDALDL
ncbi:MAG: metallophosphoesterase [Pseudomonadota bacterium]